MQTLDTTIVNTALPAIARNLNENPLNLHFVVISYALVVALLMPASGWLADRFGTRKVFVFAVVLFTLGSLCCAQSRTLDTLIASRVIQGIGGSMLLPIGRLTILRAFPHEQFLRALSFVTIPGLIGPLIGPALGGWLVEISWQWIFLINLPVGLVAGLLSLRFLPDFRGDQKNRFDLSGYSMLAFCMISITIGLDGLAESSYRRGAVVVLILAGLASFAAYWLQAKKKEQPLFPLSLFTIHAFSIGILGNLFARIGISSIPFLLPLLLQLKLGFSPFTAGLTMIPIAVAGITSKWLIGTLISRFGYRRTLICNTLFLGLIICGFSQITTQTPYWWLLIQLLIFGAFNAAQFTVMNTFTLKDLDTNLASSGNGLLSMVTQLSLSLGVSTAGALLQTFSNIWSNQVVPGNAQAFEATFLCMGLITIASTWIFLATSRTQA